ncbi:hypothetical protein LTS14_004514 [Recurvomyces mirabilis]|uniref:uncharacterized protein n=1 Tax=Recurvomyces mirabilis TaxID=574656 RepID=UPI002DE16F77|nr:hypothetical protein LTS14_004514 [Recurvomyces mirabilis]
MPFDGISKRGKSGGGAQQSNSGKTARETKAKGAENKVAKAPTKDPRPKVLEALANKLVKKTKKMETKATITAEKDTTPKLGGTSKASTNDSLVPFAFEPLPLGSISPSGWLKDQLQLMSDGLAGHEHDFYAYVAKSSWLGGTEEYSDLNEGFPYWFNGLVPLAYGLDDARLKDQVHSSAQIVLDLQASDGWLGPETGSARNFWARYPLCLGLTQLAEANSTWTQPVVTALHDFTSLMHDMLSNNYTGYISHPGDKLSADDDSWGRVRSQDMIITLQWLYEHYPGNQSQILLENMKYLHDEGLNWEDWYNEAAYFGQGMDKDLNTLDVNLTTVNYPYEHGVNVGQGLKAAAVIRRFTHNDSLIDTAMNGVNWTMQYHGAASGTVIADERLVGLAPYSGAELCTSVETMYSLSYLYQSLGNSYYADRTELAAFNFNHPQGWPKYLSSSFVRVGNSGLAHVLLSPVTARTNISGGSVMVDVTTAYPFFGQLNYSITAGSSFDFYVRVPAWAASGSRISCGSNESTPLSPDPVSGLHKISLPKGTSTVLYNLESDVYTESRENDTIAVHKGALLYALEISSTNTSTAPKMWNNPGSFYNDSYAPPQSKDWEYHNTSAWNFAVDPKTLQYHGPDSESPDYALANPIFAPNAPPAYISVMGCLIDWPLAFGSVPGYPPTGEAKKCTAPAQKLRLVPYGSAKTHMSDLPIIDLAS